MRALDNMRHRRAEACDLAEIISLLIDDTFGKNRETIAPNEQFSYQKAFEKIATDPNQYLMVVEVDDAIIGTCHLTLMPSLTFQGSTRLNIEAVRISAPYRGLGVGTWMIRAAIDYGKLHGATLIQLATHKEREDAYRFYNALGFEPSHVGMKYFLQHDADMTPT